MRRGIMFGLAIGVAVFTMGASVAQATFPGKNGRILSTDIDNYYCGTPSAPNCVVSFFAMGSFNPDGSQFARFPGPNFPCRGLPVTVFCDVWDGVFSPDGTKVAFLSYLPGTALVVVTVSAADGSGQRQLPATAQSPSPELGAGGAERLSWLPDGEHITYGGPDESLWETDLTGLVRPVLPGKSGISLAAVSPDGKQVAFTDRKQNTLYVADFPLGLQAHPIASYAPNVIDDPGPQWSPDSTRLIFDVQPSSYGLGSISSIIEMSADGTHVRTVGDGPAPTWSPDGKLIAFGCGPCPQYGQHLIANADGSNPQVFPGFIGRYGGADWQALP